MTAEVESALRLVREAAEAERKDGSACFIASVAIDKLQAQMDDLEWKMGVACAVLDEAKELKRRTIRHATDLGATPEQVAEALEP